MASGNPIHAGRDAQNAVVTQQLLGSATDLTKLLKDAMDFERGLVNGSDLLKDSSNGPKAV